MSSYRPQWLWLLMGPLLGAVVGAVSGVLLLWGTFALDPWTAPATDLLTGMSASLALGTVYGGVCGAIVGLGVGVPFVFLVGRHLTRETARRRAAVLGALLPPAALLLAAEILTDGELAVPSGEDWWTLVPLACASLLGSRLARWAAATDLPRPDVS